ncbi:MAG TPA: biosynthetic peptidoglycan transglycosylase [Thermoanaerobaculaceae bacterium]|nr:biosynthetic peptidoglycan transglycosylase [Thermoanaerobaculaceae bacterium]HPS78355.1 biosynthetic peptidoglycan transglycosylase [Thermoanaerobaculaceae bacterium]
MSRRMPWCRAGCLTVGLLGLAAAVAFGVWWASPGADLAPWRQGPLPLRWASWARQEELWQRQGLHRRPEHVFVPMEELSEELTLAVLVGEDIGYFGHGAVDPRAMWEVVGEWWDEGRLRGASTISQQVAKMLFLSGERSLGRKLREARLAFWIERRLGKRRVLEIYLNIVEFGPGLFGAEAAARHYFDTAARDLSPSQAAAIAAAIPAPGRDNPDTKTGKWEFRRDTIARRLDHVAWLRKIVARQRVAGAAPV